MSFSFPRHMHRPPVLLFQFILLAGGALTPLASALAAATDLANGPLANSAAPSTVVKPNIAFVVDDSGSMDWEHMPDTSTATDKNCWGWHKYNMLAYNPARTYIPPYLPEGSIYAADGVTRYSDASFTAAKFDGYYDVSATSTYGEDYVNHTKNLSNLTTHEGLYADFDNTTKFTGKYKANGDNFYRPAFYYSYPTATGDQEATSCLNDNKYTTVTDSANIAAPGVPNGSAAAKTNYANWYTYYRKRNYTMKAAASEAFRNLDDNYRVGLFFINSQESGANTSPKPNNDLMFGDLVGTQRATFFSRLLSHRKSGNTPLRGALSRMGLMYAGKISGWDPVQYSCQQNFTILSTDGYWNTGAETSSYRHLAIDGLSTIGNVDGYVPAVAATATIAIGSAAGASPCYRATSVTVNTGSETIELLASPPAPATCTTNRSILGDALAASINNNTSNTGFSASYSNGSNTLTITAPFSLGSFSATPTASFEKVSGSGSRTFTITAFSGGSAAGMSTDRPYLDVLNKEGTLADIAYYYYTTDLRTTAIDNCSNTIGSVIYPDLCENNVKGGGKNDSPLQHMTTYTIGLGASGTILYQNNYENAPNTSEPDYYDIKQGSVNWPDPISNTGKERIDDLWHAAVNGRGTYYSASDAKTLAAGIESALAQMQALTGSSSAAATSSLEPVSGDNFVYVALYRTGAWDGDLKSYYIDPETGALSGSETWSAQAKLNAQVSAAGANADGRTIKYFNSTATNKLKDFTYSNLNADGKGAFFASFCSKVPAPDQCGGDLDDLPEDDETHTVRATANDGNNLVGYLRGRSTQAMLSSDDVTKPYRHRENVLGDIVSALPVYLKKPQFTYDKYDITYGTFKNANENRAGTVFVAANDGMLHAFNANTTLVEGVVTPDAGIGTERWAYVPSFVMPEMWRLADRAYADNHRFFVDGSPSIADVCTSSTLSGCASASDWKTILIGGLNKGGCGYYALDVTDPTNPKGLWEFSHEQLGYSFGNPVVTRRPSDGKWVVIFASGYNNVAGGGCQSSTASSDGNGHVFVLDPMTGELLDDIPTYTSGTTPAGTTDTPSGLSKVNAWLDDGHLNIASRLYGGDLLGNLWRIDFDNQYEPNGKEATRIAQLVTSAGIVQPVTTLPELNVVKAGTASHDVVFVATGKYLGLSDPADTIQNTVYALKDKVVSDVRGGSMVSRTLTQTTNTSNIPIRTISGSIMDWGTKDGWYFDLNPGGHSPGERVTADMQLFNTSLVVPANVPKTSTCTSGGESWVYVIDTSRGLHFLSQTDGMAGIHLSSNAMIAGIKSVKLTTGKIVTIVTDTSGGVQTLPTASGGIATKLWRTLWREIPY